MIMDRLYGGVCYAGIDTDPELKYPKGAGRVAFSNQQSYIAAISARFVQLQHGDIDKRVSAKENCQRKDQKCGGLKWWVMYNSSSGHHCSGLFFGSKVLFVVNEQIKKKKNQTVKIFKICKMTQLSVICWIEVMSINVEEKNMSRQN